MKSIKEVFGLNKQNSKSRIQKGEPFNQNIKHILIVLFLLVISVLVMYCIQGNRHNRNNNNNNNNEAFNNHTSNGQLVDVLLGTDSSGNPRKSLSEGNTGLLCIYSSYMTKSAKSDNNNNLVLSNNNQKTHRILSIWRPIIDSVYEHYFGDIINIDTQVIKTVNGIETKRLQYEDLTTSIKLNLSKMDKDELNEVKIKESNISKTIPVNITIKELYSQTPDINKNLSFNILKSLGIITPKDRFNYDISVLATFVDFNYSKTGDYDVKYKELIKMVNKDYYGLSSFKRRSANDYKYIKKIANLRNTNINYITSSLDEEKKRILSLTPQQIKSEFYNDNFVESVDSDTQNPTSLTTLKNNGLYNKNDISAIRKGNIVLFPGQVYTSPSNSNKAEIPISYKLTLTESGNKSVEFKFNRMNKEYFREYLKNNNIESVEFSIVDIRYELNNGQIINISVFVISGRPSVKGIEDMNKRNNVDDKIAKVFDTYIGSGGNASNNKILEEKRDYSTHGFEKLIKFIKNTANIIDIPLEIVQLKDDETYVCMGDIIDTTITFSENEQMDVTKINNILKYRKIPKRCCYNTNQTYGDITPAYIFTTEISETVNQTVEIYKHPHYNVFKAFVKGRDDNLKNTTYIYKIQPCAKRVTKYQNIRDTYTELKNKCKNIKKSNKDVVINKNRVSETLSKEKGHIIDTNNKNIKDLREKLNSLNNDINTKNTIKRSFNRHKLQKYNANMTENLNRGYQNVIDGRNNVDVNMEFKGDPKKTLLLFANKIIDQLKLNEEERRKLLEDILAKSRRQSIEDIQELLLNCPDMSNMIDPANIPCFKCTPNV